MATKTNTAEGGTNTTTVVVGSGGNTGGASGDYFDAKNGDPATFSATQAAFGTSLSYAIPAGTGSNQYIEWNTLNSADLAIQFWVYFTGITTLEEQRIFVVRNSTGIGGAAINSDGTVRMMQGSGVLSPSASPPLSAGNWYLFNYLLLNGASASHTLEIWPAALDTAVHTYGPTAFTPGNTANLTTFRFGRQLSGANFNGIVYFDEMIVAEQSTMLPLPTPPTEPPTIIVTNTPGVAVVDARGSLPGDESPLTYSISPTAGVTEPVDGLFLVPQQANNVTYTVTVTQSGEDYTQQVTVEALPTGQGDALLVKQADGSWA